MPSAVWLFQSFVLLLKQVHPLYLLDCSHPLLLQPGPLHLQRRLGRGRLPREGKGITSSLPTSSFRLCFNISFFSLMWSPISVFPEVPPATPASPFLCSPRRVLQHGLLLTRAARKHRLPPPSQPLRTAAFSFSPFIA